MTAETRYSQIRGNHTGFPLNMGASEIFYSKSGRFVTNDGSGRGELATAAATVLQGWVRDAAPANGLGAGGLTTSSTEGADVFHCVTALDAVFRMPLAYDASTYDRNYSTALNGEHCDIVVVNGVQYCNVSASTKDILRIVGGKAASGAWTDGAVTGLTLGDGYVDVQMLQAKQYATGVE